MSPTASTLNPPTTFTFASEAEAKEHLKIADFRRLPGVIARYSSAQFSDDGTPITVIASAAGRGNNGEYSLHFVEYVRKR